MTDHKNDGLKNRLEGTADEVAGRVRNAAGGITGDPIEQVKGKAQELKGKVQRKVGEAQDRTRDKR